MRVHSRSDNVAGRTSHARAIDSSRTSSSASFGPHLASSSCATHARRRSRPAATPRCWCTAGSLLAGVRGRSHLPVRGPRALQGVGAACATCPTASSTSSPGSAPLLIFNARTTSGTSRAALPQGYWTRHFDIRAGRRPRGGARAPAAGSVARRPTSAMPFAELAAWGVARGQSRPPHAPSGLSSAPRRAPTSSPACARPTAWARAATSPPPRAFAAGASEFEIELAFLHACGLREQELPYNPIIALNEAARCCTTRCSSGTPPPQRHSLLIDAGAEFAGYASDITRTYAFGDAEFAALIERMDELQQTLCARRARRRRLARRPAAAHHADRASCCARRTSRSASADEAVDTRRHERVPAARHRPLLGLRCTTSADSCARREGGDIPRPPGHPYLRLTRVLEPGFVVTMEPGIYFIEQLLERGARRRARAAASTGRASRSCATSAASASRMISRSRRPAART